MKCLSNKKGDLKNKTAKSNNWRDVRNPSRFCDLLYQPQNCYPLAHNLKPLKILGIYLLVPLSFGGYTCSGMFLKSSTVNSLTVSRTVPK